MLKKIMMVLLLLVFVIVGGLFVFRNAIVRTVAEKGVFYVTGLELKLESVEIGITSTDLRLRNLKIYNPKSFPEPVMLDLPQLYVDYNLGDIISGIIHIEDLILDLQTFNVVRGPEGELNLNSFAVGKKAAEEEPKKEDVKKVKEKEAEKKPLDLRIDRFELRIGTISFINYQNRAVDKPGVNSFKLNIDEVYSDITDVKMLTAILVRKALSSATMAKLTGFGLEDLKGSLQSSVAQSKKLATDALGTAKGLTEEVLKTVTDGGASLSKAADNVKKIGEQTFGTTKDTTEEVVKEAVGALKEPAKVLKGFAGKLGGSLLGSKDE